MRDITDNSAINADFSGFRSSDRATKTGVAAVTYWGFLNRFGDYYIMEQNTAAGTWRYFYGRGSYTTAWSQRESLDYDYFDAIFKDA